MIISALIILVLWSASAPAQAQAPQSAARASAQPTLDSVRLVVTGDVETRLSLSLTDLGGFPRKILQVTNEHDGKEETYQGVPLEEILKRVGVPQGQQLRGAALTTYVRAEGSDGYIVVFSLPELDASIQNSDILVADTLNGEPIPDKLGPLRLIVPHDKRAARWVRMLRSLTVVKTSQ